MTLLAIVTLSRYFTHLGVLESNCLDSLNLDTVTLLLV